VLHRRPKTSGPRSLRCGFCRRRLCGPILCRSSRHARRIIAIPSWSWLAGLGLILVERFYGLAQVKISLDFMGDLRRRQYPLIGRCASCLTYAQPTTQSQIASPYVLYACIFSPRLCSALPRPVRAPLLSTPALRRRWCLQRSRYLSFEPQLSAWS